VTGPNGRRVIAVSVGLPREVDWRGQVVVTSIFKTPVATRVWARQLNLDGDRQSDLAVHGGVHKAVYAYPSEHYAWWRDWLRATDLPWGALGENLTTEGLLEAAVRIGDRLRIGSAVFTITQPRLPCFKLGIRHGRPGIVKHFEKSGRCGFYLSVVREGDVGAGDGIEILDRDPGAMTVAETARLRTSKRPERELLQRAAAQAGLSPSWREHFTKKLLGDTTE
jgi:MOSC domain-containing protein YiiM